MNPTRTYSFDQLADVIPAAFSTEPAPFVSNKYTFVRTADVIKTLYDEGWKAVQAIQTSSRKSDPRFEKHTVVLRRGDDEGQLPELGRLYGVLRLTNSHNHTSRLISADEIMRQVCGNGMVLSEGEFGRYAVRHDQIHEDLSTILERFKSRSNKQLQTAQEWNQLELSPEQLGVFLLQASELRFGDKSTVDKAKALNRVTRYDDQPNTLWAAFNRIQENGMRGCAKTGEMKRKVRGLTNIGAMDAWNQGLRDIAYKTQALLV